MFIFKTIARPYAQAVFNFAYVNNSIDHWYSMLSFAAKLSKNTEIIQLLLMPISTKIIVNTFIDICENKLDNFGKNFISILSENSRLIILPDILDWYINLCNIHNKIIKVEVKSAYKLTIKQLAKITDIIEKKYASKVKLTCLIDRDIISGLVIYVNNTVIDSSIKSRIKDMIYHLQY